MFVIPVPLYKKLRKALALVVADQRKNQSVGYKSMREWPLEVSPIIFKFVRGQIPYKQKTARVPPAGFDFNHTIALIFRKLWKSKSNRRNE